jgi:hypothetical protein
MADSSASQLVVRPFPLSPPRPCFASRTSRREVESEGGSVPLRQGCAPPARCDALDLGGNCSADIGRREQAGYPISPSFSLAVIDFGVGCPWTH